MIATTGILLLVSLALVPAPDGEETYEAFVVRGPAPGSAWFEATDGGESTWFVTIEDEGRSAEVVWHLDPRFGLPTTELRPGTRIRYAGPSATLARRIEVVVLGPLAMDAAVEDWVAESCGERPWTGLSAPEVATLEALGSPSWLVRDAVSRSLRERGPAALRLLVRARRARDAEVRTRAEVLLGRLGG